MGTGQDISKILLYETCVSSINMFLNSFKNNLLIPRMNKNKNKLVKKKRTYISFNSFFFLIIHVSVNENTLNFIFRLSSVVIYRTQTEIRMLPYNFNCPFRFRLFFLRLPLAHSFPTFTLKKKRRKETKKNNAKKKGKKGIER